MSASNSFRLTKHVTNCSQCRHHIIRQIWTQDWFEHEEGLYCTLVEDCSDSWARHTSGGPTNYRLVISDDWDVRRYADVPDWCPLLPKPAA